MEKVMHKYETIFVVDTTIGEEAVKTAVEKFTSLIENSATLVTVDEWGKRRLAYPINYRTEGYYVLVNFTAETDFPAELDRIYKITDGILRSIIISCEE